MMKRKRFTRMRLAIVAGVILSGLAVSTAGATHVFTDVADSRFFAAAVEWASTNKITTGTTATTFEPDRGVTRGESVTFLKRYDDYIVQPALADRYTKADVDAAVTAALLGTATIPSGTTITGWRTWDHTAVVDNEDWFIDVQFPGRAPVALTEGTVNFATNALASDGDATCTGTATAPTAPAGKVCIYVSSGINTDGLSGHEALVTGFEDRGFSVQGFANGASGVDMYVVFSWAYTAP